MLQCILLFVLNFILYFLFGAFFAARAPFAKGGITWPNGVKASEDITISLLAGFFFYYSLFTLIAVPVMYRWRPLSMLSNIWMVVVLVISIISLVVNRKYIMAMSRMAVCGLKESGWFWISVLMLVLLECAIVLYSYQFTLDAAYYVANVTTTVQTNSLNIYDPYTGDWMNHFEMRYFFATYPLQDAVMCKIFAVPALYQTKIIMASVVIFLTNMLYYMIGRLLFSDKEKVKILFMMLFAGIINFFFITIYTSSNFLLTRTYEGKSILGNVILPAVLYLYIRILREEKNAKWWGILFLVSFGSTVISNSSNMLLPATILVFFVPVAVSQFMKRDIRGGAVTLVRMGMCMLPGLILSLVYVAYVRGMFVFYTYPR